VSYSLLISLAAALRASTFLRQAALNSGANDFPPDAAAPPAAA